MTSTLEAREAKTKATVRLEELDVTETEKYEEDIREIGDAKRKRLKRREPVRQFVRELIIFGNENEKEQAAMQKWIEELSPEERNRIIEKQKRLGEPGYGALQAEWREWSPQEKFEGLTQGQQAPITYNIHNSQDQHYYPRVGDDERGPRIKSGVLTY